MNWGKVVFIERIRPMGYSMPTGAIKLAIPVMQFIPVTFNEGPTQNTLETTLKEIKGGKIGELDILDTNPTEQADLYYEAVEYIAENAYKQMATAEDEATIAADLDTLSTDISPTIYRAIVQTYTESEKVARQATKCAIAFILYFDRARQQEKGEFFMSRDYWKNTLVKSIHRHIKPYLLDKRNEFDDMEFLDLFYETCTEIDYFPYATFHTIEIS